MSGAFVVPGKLLSPRCERQLLKVVCVLLQVVDEETELQAGAGSAGALIMRVHASYADKNEGQTHILWNSCMPLAPCNADGPTGVSLQSVRLLCLSTSNVFVCTWAQLFVSLCEREYCTTVSAANTDLSVACVRPVCACCGAFVVGFSQGLRRPYNDMNGTL
jgi:hypothetical protein